MRGEEGAAQIEVESLRTRDRVETPDVRRLAGLEPYPHVWRQAPLVALAEEELLAKIAGAQ